MSTLTIIPEDVNGQVGGFRASLDKNALVTMRDIKEPEQLMSAHISFEQEKFRLKIHHNLPRHWVTTVVETLRQDHDNRVIVRASFRVEVPSVDDLIWVEAKDESPRLVTPKRRDPDRYGPWTGAVEYPLTFAGYNAVDGRPVYTD